MAGSFVAGQGQLKKIRAAFPPGDAPRLGSDEALRRVERIDLSFGA
jgi:hypothetical protein